MALRDLQAPVAASPEEDAGALEEGAEGANERRGGDESGDGAPSASEDEQVRFVARKRQPVAALDPAKLPPPSETLCFGGRNRAASARQSAAGQGAAVAPSTLAPSVPGVRRGWADE